MIHAYRRSIKDMDWTTTLIVIVAVALLAIFFYNRRRPAPRGTYNDRDVQSSGSIGGGPRAYDKPEVQSSGSIGGGKRGHNDPDHQSSGSIGGASVQRGEQRPVADPSKGDYTHATHDQRTEYDEVQERRTRVHDSDDVKSSGSIGGSSR
jgi:hypothetical protein